jgi:hypothetical protein
MDILATTSLFPEIRDILEKRRIVRKKDNQLRRKLITLRNKYSFLHDLVGIGSHDDLLEKSVGQCLKEFGFKQVRLIGKKFKEEDIQVEFDNKVLIFEIKGISGHVPSDNDSHQLSKWLPIRKKEFVNKQVYGIVIFNYDNKKPFDKRNPKPFDARLIKFAEGSNYGLMTSTSLYNAFISYKMGKFTIEQLVEKLTGTGEIKIDMAK